MDHWHQSAMHPFIPKSPKMRVLLLCCWTLLCCLQQLAAQNLTIQPYLQDADPHTISILWETDTPDDSIIEWGLTDALGNTQTGTSYPSEGDATVHEVQLHDLVPQTRYYYRVRSENLTSDIYSFKTPPLASEHASFRIVAMSDMQKDGSHPDKFREIVEEGVIHYLEDEFGGELIDNLALVMLPGDLVVNGNNFDQWRHDFFNPAEKLLRHVPAYPVLGNHENNSAYYFTYFKMPENGSPGYEEHWWFKDYGNTRIIGLNSNAAFANADQLNWLDDLLSQTCSADSIDFVFAQLHHPHKSELWTPGESDFTGEVIARMEQFSSNCGKPSIHFFGHTHGYSRGQSRDHKHLWINVASAGGAIDNWGEFPNFDYDEFSVSQDEYGFVVVEVIDDDDPRIVIKRIGRGDQDMVVDNELRDSLSIRLLDGLVEVPSPLYPVEVEVIPECVTLLATAFTSPNEQALHGQSHWQVTTLENGFDEPVAESWKNFENWYFEIDTQEGDDLSDEVIHGLDEFTTYYWRVRYRDREMNWSDWSTPVTFTTGASTALPNLLVNPGAENELDQWQTLEGVVEALESQVCNGVAPHSGEKYFIVGGLCEHSSFARAAQDVDVSMHADSIDAGSFEVNFGGYLSNYNGSDRPEMRVLFLDGSGLELGQTNTLTTLNSSWTLVSEWAEIPAQTRSLRMELSGTRNAGTDNDSYFDDLFLKVGRNEVDCSPLTATGSPAGQYVPELRISPNPMSDHCAIHIPEGIEGELVLQMTDFLGNKVIPVQHRSEDSFLLERGSLATGSYLLWLRKGNRLIGTGKLIIVD